MHPTTSMAIMEAGGDEHVSIVLMNRTIGHLPVMPLALRARGKCEWKQDERCSFL